MLRGKAVEVTWRSLQRSDQEQGEAQARLGMNPGDRGGTEPRGLRLGAGGDYLTFLIQEMGIIPTSLNCSEDRTSQCVVHEAGLREAETFSTG